MKILCTGNPSHFTVARAIKEVFPKSDFACRSTGYDLRMWNIEDENHFREKLQNYDVLINSSFICNGAQQKILEIAKDVWQKGHVFNIGSTAEYEGRNSFLPHYSIQKRSLRDLSLSLNSKNFKTTHLTVGGLNDGNPNHSGWLEPIEIAYAIKWILGLPTDISIPIIGIEKS